MTTYSNIQKYITSAVLSTIMVFALVTHTAQAETFSRVALQEMLNNALQQVAILQSQLRSQGGTQGIESSEINIGDSVRVTGSRLSVRSEAAGTRIGIAEQGAIAGVVDGPRQVDGYTWWLLDYQTGPDGWSAGSWLSPITDSVINDDNDDGNEKSQNDDTPNTTGTAAYEIEVLGGVEVRGNSTLADFVRLCQRHIAVNPWVEIDCMWDDRVVRSQDGLVGYVPSNGAVSPAGGSLLELLAEYQANSAQDNPVGNTSNGSLATNPGSATAPASTGSSPAASSAGPTKITVTAGESKTINIGIAPRYRKVSRNLPYGCNGINTYGIRATTPFASVGNGEAGQPTFKIETTVDAQTKTCRYIVRVKNTENNDAIVYTETIEVSIVNDSDTAPNNTAADSNDTSSVPDSGSYIVTIPSANRSLYQDLNITKSNAKSHCSANLADFASSYGSQYPGEIIKCVWDDGKGDTYSSSVRMSGEAAVDPVVPPAAEANPVEPANTFSWVTGAWGSCKNPTAVTNACYHTYQSTQDRSIICVDQSGTTVSDSNCGDSKPAASQSCTIPEDTSNCGP